MIRLNFGRYLDLTVFAFVYYVVALIIALYFWRERLDCDASYYMSEIVNTEWFLVVHHRPLGVVNQWLPVLLLKAGAPLKSVFVAFAFCDWFYYFGLFLIALYVLRDRGAALSLLLIHAFVGAINYYIPVSELIQGGSLLVICWALLRQPTRRIRNIVVSLPMLWLILCSHPLFYPTVPLLLLLLYVEENEWVNWRLIVVGLLTGGLIFWAYKRVGGYDSAQMENYLPWIERFKSLHFKDTAMRFLRFFWFVPILSLVTALLVWKKKNRLLALTVLVIPIIFYGLYLFKRGYDGSDYSFERYLYPMVLLAVTAFAYYAAPRQGTAAQFGLLGLLFVLVVYHLGWQIRYGQKLELRSRHEDRILDYVTKFPEQKFAMRPENYFATEHPALTSHLSNHTMLFSAMNNPKRPVMVLPIEMIGEDHVAKLKPRDYFIATFWGYDIDQFNQKHFPFKESALRYLNTDGRFADYPKDYFKKIRIEANPPLTFKKSKERYLLIKITNENEKPLWSGIRQDTVEVAARWYNLDGSVYGSNASSYLVADVATTLEQQVEIKTPDRPGKYLLSFDLHYGQKQWAVCQTTKTAVEVN